MKKALKIILTVLSFLLVFGPPALFMAQAGVCLAMGAATVANISIFSAACVIFGLLTIIGIATKQVYKMSTWILTIPAFIISPCFPALVIIALTQLLDDVFLEPIIDAID